MRQNEKEANEWREPKQQGLTPAAKLLQIIGGLFQVDMAHRADFSGRLCAFGYQRRRRPPWLACELAGGFSALSGRAAMARAAFF